MTIQRTYVYPGDSPNKVTLGFGEEFKAHRGVARMLVNGELIAEFNEAICDSCNAEVTDIEPCAWTESGLYCWKCYHKWVFPYLREH